MDGGRTHRGLSSPPPVLKTGKPTGTYPLPWLRILARRRTVNGLYEKVRLFLRKAIRQRWEGVMPAGTGLVCA